MKNAIAMLSLIFILGCDGQNRAKEPFYYSIKKYEQSLEGFINWQGLALKPESGRFLLSISYSNNNCVGDFVYSSNNDLFPAIGAEVQVQGQQTFGTLNCLPLNLTMKLKNSDGVNYELKFEHETYILNLSN